MKILFIAHSFYPNRNVGSFRVSYWARNFHRVDPKVNVSVYTATEDAKSEKNVEVIYLPPEKNRFFDGLITDEGLKWKRTLLREFRRKKRSWDYDVVLITGSPFLHFGITKWLKRNTNSKVILDFRDPFAFNPSFSNQSFIKERIRSHLQKEYIKQADIVVTVNSVCIDLIKKASRKIDHKKLFILENGFDDTLEIQPIKSIERDPRLKLVYAGKFLHYRNPNLLIQAIQEEKKDEIVFHYLGPSKEYVKDLLSKDYFNYHGFQNHQDALNIISSCDVAILLTGNMNFESTTKIYDYLYLNMPILVIFDGSKAPHEVINLLDGIPQVYYCKNSLIDIKNTLSEISHKSNLKRNININRFSRLLGLERLNRLIQNPTAPNSNT